MPRHRIERSGWAPWPAGKAAARARMRAAGARPRPAGHARDRGPDWTDIATRHLAAVGARFRRDRRRVMTGAVRGLLVSPWFAAGAGFVIAAGAFVYVPHAQLEFGGAIRISQCKQTSCTSIAPQGATPLTAGGGGLLTTPPGAAAGFTFSYHVLWHNDGGFSMLMSVHGKHAIGAWRLAFVLPGAEHLSVIGAGWQPSGANAGTASGDGRAAGTDQLDPGSFWRERRTGDGRGADTVEFVVAGRGKPGAPVHCVYNGSPCHFTAS